MSAWLDEMALRAGFLETPALLLMLCDNKTVLFLDISRCISVCSSSTPYLCLLWHISKFVYLYFTVHDKHCIDCRLILFNLIYKLLYCFLKKRNQQPCVADLTAQKIH